MAFNKMHSIYLVLASAKIRKRHTFLKNCQNMLSLLSLPAGEWSYKQVYYFFQCKWHPVEFYNDGGPRCTFIRKENVPLKYTKYDGYNFNKAFKYY